ncbi:hypothetical protein Sjap_020657 [Stephania japonica]|uniref:Uncharacterized protein n=1 Tax=Stephania japonica TaxID=461633 RepID=A0AAP0F8F8_9MAGN
MARGIRPRSQTLKQTRPLESLFDVEIYDMNPVLPLKCSQHHLICCEMEELRNWAQVIQKPKRSPHFIFSPFDLPRNGNVENVRPKPRNPKG